MIVWNVFQITGFPESVGAFSVPDSGGGKAKEGPIGTQNKGAWPLRGWGSTQGVSIRMVLARDGARVH